MHGGWKREKAIFHVMLWFEINDYNYCSGEITSILIRKKNELSKF